MTNAHQELLKVRKFRKSRLLLNFDTEKAKNPRFGQMDFFRIIHEQFELFEYPIFSKKAQKFNNPAVKGSLGLLEQKKSPIVCLLFHITPVIRDCAFLRIELKANTLSSFLKL